MKTTPPAAQRRCRVGSDNGNILKIEVVTPEDRKRFDRLLGQYHYLGETCPVGDFLRQVAILDGKWVGLLAWGSACYALKDRDQYIGWTPTWRAERQKLVVQNRRFLLLAEKGAQPNLASRILGASVKALPEQWLAHFGYVPLLAETFTDIEAFDGTCYKAAGWIRWGGPRGIPGIGRTFSCRTTGPRSSGSSRCGRTLWRCSVRRNCRRPIGRAHSSSAHGVMPLRQPQIESLHDHLCRVPDPRASNREFHIGAVLSIVAMSLLSGHRDISPIMRFGRRLTQAQRKSLGLPRKEGKKFYRVPGYKVYYNLLSKLNPDTLAESLSAWLRLLSDPTAGVRPADQTVEKLGSTKKTSSGS